MFSAANSDNLELRECALLLFNSLPSIFGNEQNKYLDYIKKMLLKSLCEGSSETVCLLFYYSVLVFKSFIFQVKLAALKATTSFILINSDDKAILKLFAETVIPMLQVLNVLVENDDDEPLLCFIELAEKCPQVLRSSFNPLMEICMKTITNADVSEKIKFSALEIIVSFAENAPATVRKRGTNYLIPLGTRKVTLGSFNVNYS